MGFPGVRFLIARKSGRRTMASIQMPNETDTCRKFVVPGLQTAGWDDDPHSIAEQRYFTDGWIIVRDDRAERQPGNYGSWEK